MQRTLVLAIAAAAALLGTGAAQAARVDVSVGVAVPPVAVVAGPGFIGRGDVAPGYVERVVYPAPYPVVQAPRPRFWLPPSPPVRYLPPPPWAWHHEGWRHDGWRETDHRDWHGDWNQHGRDGRRDDGHRDGGRRDGGRDAAHRGTRGPW